MEIFTTPAPLIKINRTRLSHCAVTIGGSVFVLAADIAADVWQCGRGKSAV